MARPLPHLTYDGFVSLALSASAEEPFRPWLDTATLTALWCHYDQLRRWNRLVSLVGPGTFAEVWQRHYAESLAPVPWLDERGPQASGQTPSPESRRILLDIGSGAGFPGFVLAAALPGLAVTLVETKEKKWAFLTQASRRSGVSCRCLQLRLEVPSATPHPPAPATSEGAEASEDQLPRRIDVLTVRALRLDAPILAALRERMAPGARLLRWSTGDEKALHEEAPAGFRPGRVTRLVGSERRFVVESIAQDA